MIQIFDRYVARTYVVFYLLTAVCFLGMFTVLDLLSRTDDIPRAMSGVGLEWGEILYYYLINFIFIFFQFSPYILLMSGVATVAQLLRYQEWTPMLCTGRSLLRSFMPIFVCGALFAFGTAGLREATIKKYLPIHESIQRKLNNNQEWLPKDLWVRGPNSQRLHVELFSPETPPHVLGLELFKSSRNGRDERIWADSASYIDKHWTLSGGLITDAEGEKALDVLSATGFAPDDLSRAYFARNRPLDLSLSEYENLLKYDKGHRQAETYMWSQRMKPFASLVLLILGLSSSLHFSRSSSREGLARGLLLCALFFVTELLLQDMGVRGALSPLIAGVAPVTLFAGISLWLFSRSPS